LIVHMARENSVWDYDRIIGALANLGHVVSIRPWATCYAVTASRRRRSEARARVGSNSLDLIWQFLQGLTSST
jgi:hypothetical protein